jgi:hypothetical protein
MKTILVLGDSYSFGQGCSDREFKYDIKNDVTLNYNPLPSEYCWASLIEKNNHDKCRVINLSIPGNCNQIMFKQLIRSKVVPDVVFFAGSYSDRVVFSSDKDSSDSKSVLLSKIDIFDKNEPKDYVNAKKQYLKFLFNDEIGHLNISSNIFAAYGYCMSIGSKFFWSSPGRSTDTKTSMYDGIFAYSEMNCLDDELRLLTDSRITCIQEYDFSEKRSYEYNQPFRSECMHCTDLGHKIYYDKLIQPLIQKILS